MKKLIPQLLGGTPPKPTKTEYTVLRQLVQWIPPGMIQRLADEHKLSLADVRLLDVLDRSGSARMGDLADVLVSLPSRVTRQIRRLEANGLVQRTASPEDGRGVLATITDSGRDAVRQAMVTYAHAVRVHFLDQLTRTQLAAMGDNCRRIGSALKQPEDPARLTGA